MANLSTTLNMHQLSASKATSHPKVLWCKPLCCYHLPHLPPLASTPSASTKDERVVLQVLAVLCIFVFLTLAYYLTSSKVRSEYPKTAEEKGKKYRAGAAPNLELYIPDDPNSSTGPSKPYRFEGPDPYLEGSMSVWESRYLHPS